MRCSDNPAAPKKPSIPARLIARTISTEPMPLAIAPGDVFQMVIGAERRITQLLRRQRGNECG